MEFLGIKERELIISAVKKGKVLICPTDTVYGLICDAANKKSVEKIFKIKKRPRSKPLPIFVKDLKMAKKLAVINKEQVKYLKKAWPGAITVILQKKDRKGTIALRIPNYKWLLSLIRQFKRPLAETSANISGQPASNKIKEVIRQFDGLKHQPDFVIDIGNLAKAKPSKIVDLTVDPPKVLRY